MTETTTSVAQWQVVPEGVGLPAGEEVARAGIFLGRSVADHVTTEYSNDVDVILSTVETEAPIAYAAAGFGEDGSIQVETTATLEGARAHYEQVRSLVDVRDWRPFTELRTDWYVFYNGIVTLQDVATKVDARNESIVFFPMSPSSSRIRGELAWSSHPGRLAPVELPADSPDSGPVGRVEVLRLHGRMVDALRAQDPDELVATMTEDVSTAVRDYVDGLPYRSLEGREATRDHYRRFFERFDVQSVDIVHRVIGDWFAFAELAWDAILRGGPDRGRLARFRTASMMPLMANGLVRAQFGYGTDLVLAGQG